RTIGFDELSTSFIFYEYRYYFLLVLDSKHRLEIEDKVDENSHIYNHHGGEVNVKWQYLKMNSNQIKVTFSNNITLVITVPNITEMQQIIASQTNPSPSPNINSLVKGPIEQSSLRLFILTVENQFKLAHLPISCYHELLTVALDALKHANQEFRDAFDRLVVEISEKKTKNSS
ncbi:8304_t:CDS:2, partial [Ambispora gerdemannii]